MRRPDVIPPGDSFVCDTGHFAVVALSAIGALPAATHFIWPLATGIINDTDFTNPSSPESASILMKLNSRQTAGTKSGSTGQNRWWSRVRLRRSAGPRDAALCQLKNPQRKAMLSLALGVGVTGY